MTRTHIPLRHWTAKRSGARMTVTATNAAGEPVKVAVDVIAGGHGAAAGHVWAEDKKLGRFYTLMTEPEA